RLADFRRSSGRSRSGLGDERAGEGPDDGWRSRLDAARGQLQLFVLSGGPGPGGRLDVNAVARVEVVEAVAGLRLRGGLEGREEYEGAEQGDFLHVGCRLRRFVRAPASFVTSGSLLLKSC